MTAKKHRRRTPAPEGDIAIHFGARLRQLRLEAKLSQSQLGAPYFTRAHISAIELGKVSPTLKTLVFLAGKLGHTARDLIPEDV